MFQDELIDNTVVEKPQEIFYGHRKLCLVKISKEIKSVIYVEKQMKWSSHEMI